MPRTSDLCAILCAGVLCAGVAYPVYAASPGTAALHEDVAALQALADTVSQGDVPPDTAAARAHTVVEAARDTLARADVPRAASDAVLAAADQRLREELTAPEMEQVLRDTAARLEAVVGVRALIPPAQPAPLRLGAVRDALQRELTDSVYDWEDDEVSWRLWGAVRRYVIDRVDRFFNGRWVGRVERVSFYLMSALLMIALGILGWLLLTRYGRRPGAAAHAPDTVVETRRMADPERYRTEARGHAAAGHFRDAVRASFMMTLAELEARELVAFDRTRTNTEYLRQLRRKAGPGTLADGFSGVTRTFNRTWYGKVSCSADEYQTFTERVADVVRQAAVPV